MVLEMSLSLFHPRANQMCSVGGSTHLPRAAAAKPGIAHGKNCVVVDGTPICSDNFMTKLFQHQI
jgi:hypothetical protein